ncbi:hypothetical protein BDZ85DRAFT_251618 [Elsinoe ampelina]|uniref:Uncharacterized protein n=1 Tax=Elsinoe ampelina TaxID=302913 RepID=A0A6A6G658_9PEZI|nr:hypothetical protein BDZ85DRAFT_251618 [Elsinoe ampelina]
MPPYGDLEANMEEWHRGRRILQRIIEWLDELVIYVTGEYSKGTQDLGTLQDVYVHLHNTAWLQVHWHVLNEFYAFLDHSRYCLDLYDKCALALAHVLLNARMLLEAVDRDFQGVFGMCINEMARGTCDWLHARAVWSLYDEASCGFGLRLSHLRCGIFVVCLHAATRCFHIFDISYEVIFRISHIHSVFFTSLFDIHQLCITWPSMDISNGQAQKEHSIGSTQSPGPKIDNETAVAAMKDTCSPSDHDLTHESNTEDHGDAALSTAPIETSQNEEKKLSRAASIAYIHLLGLTMVNVLLLLPLAPNVMRIATTMETTQMILDEALLTAETDQIDQIEEVTEAFDEVHAYTQMMARVMELSREVKDLAFTAMDALAEGDEEEGLRVYKEVVAKQKEMKGAIESVDGLTPAQQVQEGTHETDVPTTDSGHEDDARGDKDQADAKCADDEPDQIDFEAPHQDYAAKLAKIKAWLAAPRVSDTIAQMDHDEELMWGLEDTTTEALEHSETLLNLNHEMLERMDEYNEK